VLARNTSLPAARRAAASLRRLCDAAACSIALLEGDELVFVAADGSGADAVVGLRIATDVGLAGFSVSTGQALAVADVRRDARFAREVAEGTGYVPEAVVAVPLLGEDEVVGLVEVLDPNVAHDRCLAVVAAVAEPLGALVAVTARERAIGTHLLARAATDAGSDADALVAAARRAVPHDELIADLVSLLADLRRASPRDVALAARIVRVVRAQGRSDPA
jgi:GAF domain-containing protein